MIESPEEVTPFKAGWDALAVARGRPYCAPGWLLPWFDHVASPGAGLRLAVGLDGDEVVAVAPFFAVRRLGGLEWLRPLGRGISSETEPLVAAGREREAAPLLAGLLARSRPAVVTFEAIRRDSPWPQLLAGSWPGGRGRLHRVGTIPAPVVEAPPDGRGWLASRSRNFRSQVGRRRRRLEEAGARFERIDDADGIRAALPDFARLHRARWAWRGGSSLLDAATERMLADAAGELAAGGRMWLWVIRADGRTVASTLFLSAGDAATYWLGGHDDEWAALAPGFQVLVAAVEDAFARGIGRIDLGAGEQHYKHRLADRADVLQYATLAPRGRTFPAACGALAAQAGVRAAGRAQRRARRELAGYARSAAARRRTAAA